jgi:hypothetical protein
MEALDEPQPRTHSQASIGRSIRVSVPRITTPDIRSGSTGRDDGGGGTSCDLIPGGLQTSLQERVRPKKATTKA